MAKRVVAKTNISYGTAEGESVKFKPGDTVDVAKYGVTKEQLEQLYDAGAVMVEETPEPVKAAAPAKVPPTKATTSEVKSSGTSNAA